VTGRRSHRLSRAAVGHAVALATAATVLPGSAVAARPFAHPAALTAPTPLSAPIIHGTPAVGATLTATPGSFGGPGPVSTTFHWLLCERSCSVVPDTTGPTLTLTLAEIGARVQVVVAATGPGGSVADPSALSTPIPGPPGVLRAWMLPLLDNPGPAGRLAAVERAHGYVTRFAATIGGQVSVTWTLALSPPHSHRRTDVLVAEARTLTRAPLSRVVIRLTPAGARLLAHRSRATVRAVARFSYPFGTGTRTERVSAPLTLGR
jgi:hypothetical protein